VAVRQDENFKFFYFDCVQSIFEVICPTHFCKVIGEYLRFVERWEFQSRYTTEFIRITLTFK